MTSKKILYIDMDNTLVDFSTKLGQIAESLQLKYDGRADEIPGIFALMPPIPGAIEAYRELSEVFDTYILSTAPWDNPSAWQHKIEWVRLHFGNEEKTPAWKRLILSHHKNLNHGDFLVDDRDKNGAAEFEGELVRFGTPEFPDWAAVTAYLLERQADPPFESAASATAFAELSAAARRDQVSRATAIASIAHRCQKDKLGARYIEHPTAVAAGFGPDVRTLEHCAALLHDVLEDTIFSARALEEAGIHPEVISVVELLTRRDDDGDAYYERIRRSEPAREVKYADITHNTHPDRVARLDSETRERLTVKYTHALDILEKPWPWPARVAA